MGEAKRRREQTPKMTAGFWAGSPRWLYELAISARRVRAGEDAPSAMSTRLSASPADRMRAGCRPTGEHDGERAALLAPLSETAGAITNNGSDTAIVLTATPAMYSNYVTSATYPANAATVGMVSTNDADDTFLFECGMLIAYTPGGAPAPPPVLGLLFMN